MTPPLNRKRGSSVSFTRAKDDAEDTGDEILISLASDNQVLADHSQGSGCCGIGLPIPFERAAPRSWWNPRFDSEILEGQYKRSAYPQIRLRFRYALTYVLLVSISWLIYFVAAGMENGDSSLWPVIAASFAAVGAMASAVLYFTHTDRYRSYVLPTSLLLASILCLLSLLFVVFVPPNSDGLTLVGHFALCTEILLLIYTVIPMPLYACVGISSIYSILFEFFTAYFYGHEKALIDDINSSDNRSERNFMERSDNPGFIENFSNSTFDGVLNNLRILSNTSDSNIAHVDTDVAGAPSIVTRLTDTLNNSKLFSTISSTVISMLDNGNVISGLSDSNLASRVNPALNSSGSTSFSESSLASPGAEVSDWHKLTNLSSAAPKNSTLAAGLIGSETIGNLSNLNSTLQSINSRIRRNLADIDSDEIPVQEIVGGVSTVIIRILMQISIHLIGLHILIMTFVRMRGTFMKVGQSLLVRRQLEMEKQLKEKMINSVMPPKVAEWLMMEGSEREREREDSLKKGSVPSTNSVIHSLFRPFNMHSMENVSILFADIVGFTKMSSNKTAEELVAILNDLFERFDDLCQNCGCEKISTLGDCYYCVSGCPEPRPDHAKCCVEMGLAMIEAIKRFDIERREGVNMRVGVHTGTVLCGIVGTKRFKFDVWSNDVTLANKLESTGKPGRVHLSEATMSFLGDRYLTEDGETVNGVKSYFIRGRKADLIPQSAGNVTRTAGESPAASPMPPVHGGRNRLAPCNNQTKSPRPHYLQMLTSPLSYRVKANSLPSILDSDNDGDTGDEKDDLNKSPTSIASYGKKKTKQKPWRYLQRQRTTEEMTPLDKGSGKEEPMVLGTENSPRTPTPIHEEGINGYYDQVPVDNGIETDPMPASNFPLIPNQESGSQAPSVCSRKDSGIRSASRRSSIQQQLFLMNGMAGGDILGHRVSGYYTSSQSTLNSTQDQPSSVPPYPFPPAVTEPFSACFHQRRKQSDLQLIRCVQDNVSSQRSYFVKPPLSSVTLFFKNKEMEQEYRETAHKASEGFGNNPPTLATSRFNTYFDILISALVLSSVTVSLFLLYRPTTYYIVFSAFATAIQLFAVYLCIRQLLNPRTTHTTFTNKVFKFFSQWHPWHICGAVLVSLPIVSILINFTHETIHARFDHIEYYYSYLIFVGLVHFCNFTQLNCWMKNLLVTIAGVLFIALVASHVTTSVDLSPPRSQIIIGITPVETHGKEADEFDPPSYDSSYNVESSPPVVESPDLPASKRSVEDFENFNAGSGAPESDATHRTQSRDRLYKSEIFLDMGLLLLLVWFLNREFEISYRLSFHGNAVAARDKASVQSMKNQADWLLHNIIPKYVADQLKTTAKYSQNHKSVGIIFASIVNFNELYDESYSGGKEYLRVLNELIGDFDELLEKPEFSNVEKIKTIGSTFMAASGLNPQVRQQNEHEYTHLFQLLDFAVALHKVIYDFNRDLLGFKLILRIGYNYGDVTAGVIGATKLYYDIWGDAVNIASRMDSTGVAGRIQLASNCLEVLAGRYEFEPRGQVYVKGKDNMDVFLLTVKATEGDG